MQDDALSSALEAALLRQLLATWRTLNDSYFKGRLRAPTLALADGAHKLGQWLAADRRIELQRAFVVDGAWGAVVEVHELVAGLLGDPGFSGVGGDPGDVYAATVALNHQRM